MIDGAENIWIKILGDAKTVTRLLLVQTYLIFYLCDMNTRLTLLSEDKEKLVDKILELEEDVYKRQQETGAVAITPAYAQSFEMLVHETDKVFKDSGKDIPLPANYIPDAADRRNLTAFFAWGAWAAVTPRPGKDYSYTNNWPPDEQAGNRPSLAVILWSALSVISLLGALGLVLMFFGRFD